MSGVQLSGLRKYFTEDNKPGQQPKRGAIDGLDLHIEDGEFFVLLGPSGCGKTTTLRCIAGLEEPSAGRIAIGGETVADPQNHVFVPPNKRNLGMVFQSYALWPHMSVYENVAYPLKHSRQHLNSHEIANGVAQALRLVGLEGHASKSTTELSGGQQQRVALARALAAKPRLLLFDEPLSNLDAQLRVRLRHDLRRIHDETGHTSIYVTHDQAEALALADRVAVMNNGQLDQLGTPAEIFLTPATRFVAEFVGYDNLIAARVVASTASGATLSPEGWPREVRVSSRSPLRPGQRAWLAIRSGNLRINPGPAPQLQENALTVSLDKITYIGERYQGEVRLGDTPLLGSLFLDQWGRGVDHDRRLIGTQAHIAFLPGEAVALPFTDEELAQTALKEAV